MDNLKPVKNLQPFRHFCMSIGVLPTSYLESLSYAELLYWFCDYLKNTVIPTINNNSECITELQENYSSFTTNITNLYNQLKDYVDNYFKNLDVQEEINQKLDDMVTSGELESIINRTLIFKLDNFNNSNEIEASDNLITDNSLWQLNEGWYSSQPGSFEHIIGKSTPLVYNHNFEKDNKYIIEFDVLSPLPSGGENASNDFSVIIGNSEPIVTYRGGGSMHYNISALPTENGPLQFICVSASDPYTTKDTFNGTIKNISVKKLSGTLTQNGFFDKNNELSLTFTNTLRNTHNVSIGNNANISNYKGDHNVFLGFSAGMDNVSGFYNVGVGANALQHNIIGSRNVALGFDTLQQNKTGDRNIAIGGYCLATSVSGRRNIGIGFDTLDNLISGDSNIALGNQALQSSHNSLNNIAIGTRALGSAQCSGNGNNIGVGANSLNYLTSGTDNLALGRSSLYKLTTGSNNIAIGLNALNFNQESSSLIAIGVNAGNRVVSGKFGTIIGNNHSMSLTNLNNSTLIGLNIGTKITSFNNSIIIGNNITTSSDSITSFNNVFAVNPGNTGSMYLDRDNYFNICKTIFGDISDLTIPKVGIYVPSPTAYLHLPAGRKIANSAPLKFSSGFILNTPEDGALEYDGSHLYFTIGSERHTLV